MELASYRVNEKSVQTNSLNKKERGVKKKKEGGRLSEK